MSHFWKIWNWKFSLLIPKLHCPKRTKIKNRFIWIHYLFLKKMFALAEKCAQIQKKASASVQCCSGKKTFIVIHKAKMFCVPPCQIGGTLGLQNGAPRIVWPILISKYTNKMCIIYLFVCPTIHIPCGFVYSLC